MKISIGIAAYNSSTTLKRAIESVLNQTYQNFELIIVDDGSTDDTPKIIEKYKKKDERIIFYRWHKNRGYLSARNKTIELSSGELWTFLDHDDELTKEALQVVAKKYKEVKKIGVKILWFDRIEYSTGNPTGTGLTTEGIINFSHYLCDKIRGDFWHIIDGKLMRTVRFDEKTYGFESLLWLELHEKEKAYYFPGYKLYIYHTETQHRISKSPYQLDKTILQKLIYTKKKFLNKYSTLLLSLCPPTTYSEHLRRLAYYYTLLNQKKTSLYFFLKSLKHHPLNPKTLKFLLLSFLLPPHKLALLPQKSSPFTTKCRTTKCRKKKR